MLNYLLNIYNNNISIILEYLNYYTLITFFTFYIIGIIWSRTYPTNFIEKIIFYFWFIFMLPGTFAHETMHFILGVFFKAKPTSVSIIPKKIENGYILGSVSFNNMNFINALPVSMAPFFLIPLSFYMMLYFSEYFLSGEMSRIYAGFFIYNLWISSIPSSTDFRLLLKFPLTIIFYGIIIFALVQLKEL